MPPVRMTSIAPRLSTMPPDSLASRSTFPPLSFPPEPDTLPPARAVSSIPPRKKSSRPPRPVSNRPRAKTPSVDDLLAMLAQFPEPGLGNIEIYYRLGLAYLAAQDVDEARKAFLTVEDISPGYRDATAYLEQLLPKVAEHAGVTKGSGPANHNANAAPGAPRVRERNLATGRRRDER
jgi:hypothetical protein